MKSRLMNECQYLRHITPRLKTPPVVEITSQIIQRFLAVELKKNQLECVLEGRQKSEG